VTAWKDLSNSERVAVRKLALGYRGEVTGSMLRRLAKLGIVEEGPHARLTAKGFELSRANPRVHKGGRPRHS
jgi:hypothetical protein